MDKNESEILLDMRERIVRIETILQGLNLKDIEKNLKEIEKTAIEAKEQADKNAKDIAELRSYVKWFVAAIIGAFLAALASLVIK